VFLDSESWPAVLGVTSAALRLLLAFNGTFDEDDSENEPPEDDDDCDDDDFDRDELGDDPEED